MARPVRHLSKMVLLYANSIDDDAKKPTAAPASADKPTLPVRGSEFY